MDRNVRPAFISYKENVNQKFSDLEARFADFEQYLNSPAASQSRARSFSEECRNGPLEHDDGDPRHSRSLDAEVVSSIDDKFNQLGKWMTDVDRRFLETETRVLECEQYTRRECIVISGIPANIKEDELESTVLRILRKLDINIYESDISAIHRLGASRDPRYPARVIVNAK